jgi:hypothetical protein
MNSLGPRIYVCILGDVKKISIDSLGIHTPFPFHISFMQRFNVRFSLRYHFLLYIPLEFMNFLTIHSQFPVVQCYSYPCCYYFGCSAAAHSHFARAE